MQSKVNRRRTLIVMLPLVCAIAALLALAHRSAQQGSSAVSRLGGAPETRVRSGAEGPVSLRGEEAIKQLKQQGTYESLAAASPRLLDEKHSEVQSAAFNQWLNSRLDWTKASAGISDLMDSVRAPLTARLEEQQKKREGLEENEPRGDHPDEAMRFRNMQMQDENGNIPVDGLQRAREQMAVMKAAQQPPQAVLQSVLDDLRTLRQTITDRQDGRKLDDAIRSLTRALEPNLWLDPTRLQPKGGERVFDETKDAVNKLRDLMKDKKSAIPDAILQGFIDRIVDADRRLAQTAINDAIAAGGNQQHITKANDELGKGDSDAANSKFEAAIEHYREAWKHALKAVRRE